MYNGSTYTASPHLPKSGIYFWLAKGNQGNVLFNKIHIGAPSSTQNLFKPQL